MLRTIIIYLNQFSQQNYFKIPKVSEYSPAPKFPIFPVEIYPSQNSREFCIPLVHRDRPLTTNGSTLYLDHLSVNMWVPPGIRVWRTLMIALYSYNHSDTFYRYPFEQKKSKNTQFA